MSQDRHPKIRKALDTDALHRLALHYVARYATTTSKLGSYLRRKVLERGWNDPAPADFAAIVARCVALGYVDDRAFAQTRAAALGRRGFGARRIGAALQAAGIDRDTAQETMPGEDEAWIAADVFARRKRIGRYGEGSVDARQKQRQFAAMLRAGHGVGLARCFVDTVNDDKSSETA